ncbi:sensor histidine kinase [Actinoplanes couchii]|uniref:histidine kinase n=1 Tax=Actinoplanes couchii TaxID=403638 RepID=A0ABQ3X8E2_9ACTN|nr:histidine kinase [Actinoplanes couchii]MDR6320223.1 MYXO-CTERM domain-containing protein [Actinoplanes couchii]GID54762.1 two-component sensor histidine kinase [Actinoplanes couchii]
MRHWSLGTWRPQLVDAVAGVVLFGATSVVTFAQSVDSPAEPWPDPLDAVAALAAVLLITLRRRRPLPVFLTSAGLTLLGAGVPWLLKPAGFALLICTYTVATTSRRVIAWSCGVLAGAVAFVAAGDRTGSGAVAIFVWAGLAVVVGDLVRTRRAYRAEVVDRARRVERSREEETRRQVVEERLRIARELHDVVAHHIAMINVQAGVAAHLLRSSPDQAEQSLAHVRQAGRTVLDELSTVLGVLRDPDHPAGTADEPARGLQHLPELIDQVTGVGLRVEHTQVGEVRTLPAATDLAAYRIIQESLTNAHKYASDDRARLRLCFTATTLEITVDNHLPDHPRGDGYGLIGMRERAVALGGELTAGATGGRFVVRALLPAPGEAS